MMLWFQLDACYRGSVDRGYTQLVLDDELVEYVLHV